jgi:hypothetical protein
VFPVKDYPDQVLRYHMQQTSGLLLQNVFLITQFTMVGFESSKTSEAQAGERKPK